jgi:hypothetical protein
LKMWMTPFFSPTNNFETSSGCQATDMTADLKYFKINFYKLILLFQWNNLN